MVKRAAFIAAAIAGTLLAGGTAGAALAAGTGPVDSSGVIHGCWTNREINGSHAFMLQDAGTTCPRGTTAIEWNQQGPAGPQGPPGPEVLTYGGVSDNGASCSFFIGPSGANAADVTVSFDLVDACVVSGFPADTMPVSIPSGATFNSSTGQITLPVVGVGAKSVSFLFAVLETQS